RGGRSPHERRSPARVRPPADLGAVERLTDAGDLALAAALDRRADAHRLAIFDDRAAGNVEAALLEQPSNRIVAQDFGLGVDQLLDPRFHRIGGRTIAFRRSDP